MVGDEGRHSTGGGDFAAAGECLSAFRIRPMGGSLGETAGGKAEDFRLLGLHALLWVEAGAVCRMAQDGGQTDASETAADQAGATTPDARTDAASRQGARE